MPHEKLVLIFLLGVQTSKARNSVTQCVNPFVVDFDRSSYTPLLKLDMYSKLFFFFQQANDVGLMTYLGAMNKACYDINLFINRFNVIYDRQGMGRRMRGLIF